MEKHNLEDQIPLRCRSCHLFIGDIALANSLENAKWAIRKQREGLKQQGLGDADLGLQEAHTDLELAVLSKRIGRNVIKYTVGCKGYDLSDMAGTGETARIGRCQSPELK